jgi:phage major head subunit gpT-like protein
MPFIRGGWAELLAPGLNSFTFNRLRERPSQFARYVNVQTSNRAWEDSFETSGFGPLAKKAELSPTMLDEPLKLGGVRFIHDSFALGFLASEEMRDDEQYGMINMLAGSLGRSARITAELYGHDVLNNGFSSAKYAGRDGLALFSTAHPLVGTGGTYGNTPSVAVDLSEAGIEAGIASFDNMVDDRGITTESSARILLVTPNDRMLAKRLMNSPGFPGSNNNDINPLMDEGITIMVSNWLTDPDAWFLLPSASESPIMFYWRKQPDTKTWDDDNADGTYHKIKQRHSTGFNDWRGAYGSPGA